MPCGPGGWCKGPPPGAARLDAESLAELVLRAGMVSLRIVGMLAVAAVAAVSPLGAEVVRDGDEFQVNTYSRGYQFGPSTVITDAAGTFVVVWSSEGQDGAGLGVFGQRFASDGTKREGEFQVNTFTPGDQWAPAVAPNGTGGFVVAWESREESDSGVGGNQDGSSAGIFARRFASDGAPAGGEIPVNTMTAGPQRRPTVAADAAGRFVVAWEGGDEYGYGDGSASGVFVRRFDAGGTGLGPERPVNTTTAGPQRTPYVAAAGDGRFVVVWRSPGDTEYAYRIVGRRFSASGAPLGLEFDVNTTAATGYGMSVAANRGGDFIVSWVKAPAPVGPTQVMARRMAADGTLGNEFQVSERADGYSSDPAVSVDVSGEFVVVWHTYANDESYGDVAARHFQRDGTPSGPEFVANTNIFGYQEFPAVAFESGRFVVAWTGYYADGEGDGVAAQRFLTSLTSTTSSTTTVPGTTNTTVTVTSTTRPGTTTTTLPPGPCDGQTVPAGITARLDQVRDTLAEVRDAEPKVAKRLLKKAAKLLKKVKPLVKKAERARKHPLSMTCSAALRTVTDQLATAVRAARS